VVDDGGTMTTRLELLVGAVLGGLESDRVEGCDPLQVIVWDLDPVDLEIARVARRKVGRDRRLAEIEVTTLGRDSLDRLGPGRVVLGPLAGGEEVHEAAQSEEQDQRQDGVADEMGRPACTGG
jgi:hypothetical protein